MSWRVGQGVHAWPLFERDPEAKGWRTDVLWPLASVRTKEEGGLRQADFFWPVFHYSFEDGRLRYGVRPLFDWLEQEAAKPGEQGVSDLDLLFPIVKWRESPEERRFEVRPLFFDWDGPESEGTTFFPFYWRREAEESSYMHVWPLYGWNRQGTSRTDSVLPPFFSRTEDPVRERIDWEAFPLFHYGRDPENLSVRAFPFLWMGESPDSSYFHVWPLYGWNRSGTERRDWILPPIFSHATDPATESVEWDALPLFHYRRSRDGTAVTALPLLVYSRSQDGRTLVLFPFWWDFEDGASRFRMLFPFYGEQREGEGFERTIVGGPLFIATRDGEKRSTDLLWPLVHAESDPEGWGFRIGPILRLDRRKDFSATDLLARLSQEPWEGETTRVSLLGELFWYGSGPKGWRLNLAPAGIARREDGNEAYLFPLFHDKTDAAGRQGSVLWQVARWERTGEDEREFRVLWRLVQWRQTKQKSTFVFNPLFRRETNDRGDLHWSALFGLLARTREGDETNWRFLWFFRG